MSKNKSDYGVPAFGPVFFTQLSVYLPDWEKGEWQWR